MLMNLGRFPSRIKWMQVYACFVLFAENVSTIVGLVVKTMPQP
jgi:hypothetical protein